MSTQMLIPLDGSELAEAALPYAEQLAKALGWGAVLFSVVPHSPDRPGLMGTVLPVETTTGGAVAPWPAETETTDTRRDQEEAAMYAMLPAEERLHRAGVQATREVGVGDAAEVIAGRATGEDIAMIVIASHGRTGLDRLFRGSVATGVVHHTDRPTLVVRPFRDQEQRVHLEHADHLAPEQAEAVQRAMSAGAS
jgi:nucleotide-binding universal stress UspA family protein